MFSKGSALFSKTVLKASTDFTGAALVLGVFALVILFTGEPGLHDAWLSRVAHTPPAESPLDSPGVGTTAEPTERELVAPGDATHAGPFCTAGGAGSVESSHAMAATEMGRL